MAQEAALLRDLIDRRPDQNLVALRPGQAVHVHALERVLGLVGELAGCRTFAELADWDSDTELKPSTLDEMIICARQIMGTPL